MVVAVYLQVLEVYATTDRPYPERDASLTRGSRRSAIDVAEVALLRGQRRRQRRARPLGAIVECKTPATSRRRDEAVAGAPPAAGDRRGGRPRLGRERWKRNSGHRSSARRSTPFGHVVARRISVKRASANRRHSPSRRGRRGRRRRDRRCASSRNDDRTGRLRAAAWEPRALAAHAGR